MRVTLLLDYPPIIYLHPECANYKVMCGYILIKFCYIKNTVQDVLVDQIYRYKEMKKEAPDTPGETVHLILIILFAFIILLGLRKATVGHLHGAPTK